MSALQDTERVSGLLLHGLCLNTGGRAHVFVHRWMGGLNVLWNPTDLDSDLSSARY